MAPTIFYLLMAFPTLYIGRRKKKKKKKKMSWRLRFDRLHRKKEIDAQHKINKYKRTWELGPTLHKRGECVYYFK